MYKKQHLLKVQIKLKLVLELNFLYLDESFLHLSQIFADHMPANLVNQMQVEKYRM